MADDTNNMDASEKTTAEQSGDSGVRISGFLNASSARVVGQSTPHSTVRWSLALFQCFSTDLKSFKDQRVNVAPFNYNI